MTTYTKIIASIAIAAFAATASFAQQVKTDYDPIVVAALAAASSEQQVKTDYDRSTSFSKYKTYSWEKVQTQDPLWVDRIKEAVDSALTAQGLRLVKSGGDIAIVAVEMTKTRQNLNTFYSGFGGGWRWGGGFGDATTTVDNYKVGTLVVDLFDAQTKTLLWRGSSSNTLSDKSDKNIKNLDKGVQKMFHHFPPDVKKDGEAR